MWGMWEDVCVFPLMHIWGVQGRGSQKSYGWRVLRNNPLTSLWVPWAGLSRKGQLTLRSGLGIRSSSTSERNRERRK